MSSATVQVGPLVDLPCLTPLPTKSYWIPPPQRPMTSKRSGRAWGCSGGGVGGEGGSDHWKGGGVPPPPLQGAQPMPSHCPRDAKCRLQRHL